VFALSDRVSGGVRDVTDYLPPFLGGSEPVEAPPLPSPRPRSPSFGYGFLCGLVVMAVVTSLAIGRW
jgi:hypothetical protein